MEWRLKQEGMKRKTRILHVVLSLDYGGTEKIVVDIANGLPREYFESSIICMDRYGQRMSDVREDVPVYLMNRKPGLSPVNFHAYYKYLKIVKPDIVHFRNFTTYFWGCIVSKFQRRCRIVYSDHSNIVEECKNNQKAKLFTRRLLKHITDNFMTNSDTFKEILIDSVHLDPDNVVVIQNGVDTDRFYPMRFTEKQSLRHQLGFNDRDFIVGIVAGFSRKKNLSLAVEAMKDLLEKIPAAKLMLVGSGKLEKKLKTLANDLGLSNKIYFNGSTNNVNALLNAFDLFLFPSSFGEGMPNAVLEAMAAKVPVAASDIQGNIELLHDGQRGILFRNNDKDSLVKTVIRLANDKVLSDQIADRGYQYVKENMSLHKMIERYEKFYSAVYNRQQNIDM